MAKCCHDLDLIAWLMDSIAPASVFSTGSIMNFRPENAPPASGSRCLVDCPIEPECPYSARAQYAVNDKWDWAKAYVWPDTDMNESEKIEFLKTSPHGRCVWRCDNNQVDHQTVVVEFTNGAVATHNLLTGTARPTRSIHIIGLQAELAGDFESGVIKLRTFNTQDGTDFDEEIIDTNIIGDGGAAGHGGGDQRLIAEFVEATNPRGMHNLGSSRIEDSTTGHMLGYAADISMNQKRVVRFSEVCS